MSCIVNGVTMSPTQMSDFTHSLRAYSCHQRAEVGYISKTVQQNGRNEKQPLGISDIAETEKVDEEGERRHGMWDLFKQLI